MAASCNFGSSASDSARRIWFVVQISSAVTFASSVAVSLARRSFWIVSRRRPLPHQPARATNPALTSGRIQNGCFKRPGIGTLSIANFQLLVGAQPDYYCSIGNWQLAIGNSSHPHDLIPAVDVKHLARDGGRAVAGEE